jgi:predicted RNA-binding Zn-ribbon protein involved in translation (DUF1610 family)
MRSLGIEDWCFFGAWSLGFGASPVGHNGCSSVPIEIAMAKNVEATAATEAGIIFRCQHCKAELVLQREETRLSMKCVQCGKLTAVPRSQKRAVVVDPAAQIEEIQRKLTENASQTTEVTGYINQASIQLHRWQLRLQQLNERKEQLEKELAALK